VWYRSVMAEDRPESPGEPWASGRAARWISRWQAVDRQLTPVTQKLFAAADIRPGERVLDVGCGTGPTTRLAASVTGPTGSVVGVDVVAEMLETARDVTVEGDSAPIEWLHADASVWAGTGEPFDLVLSRFGVMFFDDPPLAFANLLDLTAPGGRLCMVTWQRRTETSLFELPVSVALSCAKEWGITPTVPQVDAGPFSLHQDMAREVLEHAGWRDVATAVHEVVIDFGDVSPEGAARSALESGTARTVTEAMTPAQIDGIRDVLAEQLGRHVGENGSVCLDGAVAVSTAWR